MPSRQIHRRSSSSSSTHPQHTSHLHQPPDRHNMVLRNARNAHMTPSRHPFAPPGVIGIPPNLASSDSPVDKELLQRWSAPHQAHSSGSPGPRSTYPRRHASLGSPREIPLPSPSLSAYSAPSPGSVALPSLASACVENTAPASSSKTGSSSFSYLPKTLESPDYFAIQPHGHGKSLANPRNPHPSGTPPHLPQTQTLHESHPSISVQTLSNQASDMRGASIPLSEKAKRNVMDHSRPSAPMASTDSAHSGSRSQRQFSSAERMTTSTQPLHVSNGQLATTGVVATGSTTASLPPHPGSDPPPSIVTSSPSVTHVSHSTHHCSSQPGAGMVSSAITSLSNLALDRGSSTSLPLPTQIPFHTLMNHNDAGNSSRKVEQSINQREDRLGASTIPPTYPKMDKDDGYSPMQTKERALSDEFNLRLSFTTSSSPDSSSVRSSCSDYRDTGQSSASSASSLSTGSHNIGEPADTSNESGITAPSQPQLSKDCHYPSPPSPGLMPRRRSVSSFLAIQTRSSPSMPATPGLPLPYMPHVMTGAPAHESTSTASTASAMAMYRSHTASTPAQSTSSTSTSTLTSGPGTFAVSLSTSYPAPEPPTILAPDAGANGPARAYEPFLSHAPPPEGSWIAVETTTGEYKLTVRLPGFSRDGITLATKRRRILHVVADNWENGGGHFERRIAFGYDADLVQVRAEFDGEMLRISIPRRIPPVELWQPPRQGPVGRYG